jgi:hypothetical protein
MRRVSASAITTVVIEELAPRLLIAYGIQFQLWRLHPLHLGRRRMGSGQSLAALLYVLSGGFGGNQASTPVRRKSAIRSAE